MDCCTLLDACKRRARLHLLWATLASLVILFVTVTTRHIRNIETHLGATEREAAAQSVYVIPDALPADVLEEVTRAARGAPFVRRSTPMRDGEAVSSHTLSEREELRAVLRAVRDPAFAATVRDATGMLLQLVPRTDENHVSVLRYSRAGDGIDAHLDGNVYVGNRWVGILVLADDGDASLVLGGEALPTQPPNTLVLFRGDATEHSVTRRTVAGERLVLNILLCDVCAPRTDVFSKVWSSVVSHRAFY